MNVEAENYKEPAIHATLTILALKLVSVLCYVVNYLIVGRLQLIAPLLVLYALPVVFTFWHVWEKRDLKIVLPFSITIVVLTTIRCLFTDPFYMLDYFNLATYVALLALTHPKRVGFCFMVSGIAAYTLASLIVVYFAPFPIYYHVSKTSYSVWIALIIALVCIYMGGSAYAERVKIFIKQLHERHKQLDELNLDYKNLFATVTHDFSNDVTVIKTLAEVTLRDQAHLSDFSRNNILNIKKRVDWMRTGIENLQGIRLRSQSGLPLIVNDVRLSSILEKIRFTFEDKAKIKGIQLLISFDNADAEISVEPVSFSLHILNNLISNALKFAPMGSDVVIKTKKHDEQLELIVQNVSVESSGEKVRRAFSESSSVESSLGTAGEVGQGIGLSIVKTFCSKLEIKILLETIPAEAPGFVYVRYLLYIPMRKIQNE